MDYNKKRLVALETRIADLNFEMMLIEERRELLYNEVDKVKNEIFRKEMSEL
jgi:hypothetical protein